MASQNIYNELYVSNKAGGGPGGDPFVFAGGNEGVFLRSLIFYASDKNMKAVGIELSNGTLLISGNDHKSYDRTRMNFVRGETFQSIQVYSVNPDAPIFGGITIKTTTDVKTAYCKGFKKYPVSPPTDIPVGTGDCVGVIGRAGSDLNCIGFAMLKDPRPVDDR